MPRVTSKDFKASQRGSPAAAIGLLSLGALAMHGAHAQKLPQGGTVVSGQAAIGSPSGSNLTVTQGSQRAIIEWNGFSVGQNNSVNFVQPNASAAILNRVTGSASSTIAGQVTGNGQVYLVNPNGIAITPTGTVQVGGGFIASTLDIGNSDFNAGKLNFVGQGASAGVSNAGKITSAPGGFVGLIGGTVANDGTINVPLGKVGLASGERVTIDPTGDGFLQVAVPTGATAADGRALIDVGGRISARGGNITIKAATAQQAVRDAVNVSGLLSARSASGHNGSIVLGGGDGGNVVVTGQLKATGSKRQKGGSIAVTGNTIELRGAIIDGSGGAGGGTIEIGGGPQGGGPLQHAVNTTIDPTSTISANATGNGNGGNVTVWSDGSTAFAGRISARGGPQGGDGGQVEVSSHGVLDYAGLVDTQAPKGKVGTLLLDPYDLTIQTAPGFPLASCSSGSCTPAGSGSILTVATLQAALVTSDVTVSTGSSGSDAGNISVNNAITWYSSYGLTLNAAGGITVASGASITASGAGSLTLNAGDGSITVNSATLSTNGGNLNISAAGSGAANAIYLSDTTLSVGTGTGTIGGTSTSGVGLLFGGANSISSSGAGSISLAGTSDSNNGVHFLNAATLNSSGSVSISGTSNTGNELYFSGSNTVTDSAGDLTITGSNSSYRGAEFWNANTLANNGTGTITISGSTTSNDINNGGLQFNASSTLSASGSIVLIGSSQTTPAVAFDTTGVTVSSGNLSIIGISSSGLGVSFLHSNTLSNNGSGGLYVNGISGPGSGVDLYGSSSVTTAGAVALSGTSSSSSGILFSSGTSLTASSGSLDVEGYSSSGYGLQLMGTNTLVNGGAASMTLSGTSTSGAGTALSGSENLTTSGDMSLSGISSSFIGFYLAGANALMASGGNLSIYGTSSNNAGILFAGQDSLTNNGGTLSFNGTSSSYRGLDFYDSDNVTFSGGVTLRGTSTSGRGVNFQRSTVTNSSGDLTIDVTSSTGTGTNFNGTNSLTNSGSGTMSLTATSGANTGFYLGGGAALTTSGAMSLSGASTSGVGLQVDTGSALTQSSGNLALSGTNSSGTGLQLRGTSSTVTNNGAGTLSFNSTGAMDIGGQISSANGNLSLVSSSDITIEAGALISGASPVLAANGAFINNSGSTAVTAASGRWLIYSNTPGSDTFGNLDSGNSAIWDSTYASLPPASVTASGNRYLFAFQPTLTVTSTNASKTYGTDATGSIASNYTITGLQGGVANAYLGDSPSTYSGTPTVTSAGADASAGVAGSPYTINVGQGTFASTANYAFAFQNTGQMTVNPAPVDVTALGGSSTYGSSPANPGLAATGLQNGESISVLTGLLNSFGITASSNVGTYATNVTGSLTNANYTLAGTTSGSWIVNPADLTITALNQSKTYGTALALGTSAFSTSGLMNSDSVSSATLSSPGSSATASVAGAPYAITPSSAAGSGLSNYTINYATGVLAVNPAPITVTANGGSSTYGSSPSNPGLSASGLQNGENVGALTGLSNSFGITNASNAGSYTTNVDGTLTNANYTVVGTNNGTWIVNPAPVTVTALGGSSTYGSSPTNPGLGATGLQNGESTRVLTGLLNSFGITGSSNVGSYAMNVVGSLTNANYTLVGTASGNWIVNPAALTITALNQSKTYGTTPALGTSAFSTSGLLNSDSVSSATLGSPGSSSFASVAGGPYAITPSSAAGTGLSNYMINYATGLLAVNPAQVNVTALGGSSSYGSSPSNPGLSASGLQNGENVSALTGLRNSFGITNDSNAGNYTTLVAGSLTNANYTVNAINSGIWQVNPASVTVTALGGSSVYGSSPSNPGLAAIGLRNGQDVGVLTGISNSFGINSGSAAGNYKISVAGALTNPNYTVTSTNAGNWSVSLLRGGIGAGTPIPGGSDPAPPKTDAADASIGSPGAIGGGNSAASKPNGRGNGTDNSGRLANSGSGLPGQSPPQQSPVIPPSAAVPLEAPQTQAPFSPAATRSGCGSYQGAESGSAGGGGTGGCAPAVAKKPAGLINFALTKLNRAALSQAMDREMNDLMDFKKALPAAARTVIAGTSLAVTAGVVGWLLRSGALISALLSSMPMWRPFDPLAILQRPRRRPEEEEDELPSDADRMFDGAGGLHRSAPGLQS